MDILSFITTLVAYTLLRVPCLKVSFALDSIFPSQALSDGTTLISSGGTFELGFFSPGSSNKRYLGIWFKNIPVQTVVWVANRANPINDSTGILTLNNIGNLVLTHNNTPIWDIASSLRQPSQQNNPVVAQLLDTGNLVVREENDPNSESYLWQSFDDPTDTTLAGMKFGYDKRIGLNRRWTAWTSWDDPTPSEFSWGVVMHEYPDVYMVRGTQVYTRLGPWNGLRFSGVLAIRPNPVFDYKFILNKDEGYYTFTLKNSSVISIMVLNRTNYARYRYVWSVGTSKNWEIYSEIPGDQCDNFGQCGANAYCVASAPQICQCLKGFKPKSPQDWAAINWSEGCVRSTPLNCKYNYTTDGFVKLVRLKVPDTTHTWLDQSQTMSLDDCRQKCLHNCSCMAFTNSDIRAGKGCVMWFGDLIDIKQFDADGQELYLRMDALELDREETARGRQKKLMLIVVVIGISGAFLLGFYRIYIIPRNKIEMQEIQNNNEESDGDLDLPLLDLWTIAIATDMFSEKNKIGEGGFGPVYKGRLVDGQEIAVKKLSRSSGQGITEFKNEAKLIAKLQHRNLVKLLGYCIQGQEKILVYEYLPNNSLDSFIFDSTKGKLLDWPTRFQIICGIARGFVYLHQDSRLRIIHRDLKASNVLLDNKLNPKISDFGLAKTCNGDQIEGSTNRVVGTYGYMAPEYISDGQFSVKSDVFSFGILLLEIISGKRNRGFYHADYNLNLSGYAWKLWNESKGEELIDPNMEDSCIVPEALRCLQVSLLCVQQYPKDRPNMPSIVLMLGSEIELLMPKEPGFFPRQVPIETSSSSNQGKGSTINEITNTSLAGR